MRDYVASSHQEIDSWLSGASRETFGAELILLSLEARKISDAFDLSGIALASAMGLFETVEGGYQAAQRVFEHNSELGEDIPPELLNFLENPPKSGKQIGRSAKYARRDLLVWSPEVLNSRIWLPKYSTVKKPKKSERPNELAQTTAIGLIHAALAPFSKIIGPQH